MKEQVYPIRPIQSVIDALVAPTSENLEALGLEITRSLENVFHFPVYPYHAWISPGTINIDFLIASDFPSLHLQGRCYTSIDQRVSDHFITGCTIIPFMNGKRFTVSGDAFPSTIYLSLEVESDQTYWSYGRHQEDYAEVWDDSSPAEVEGGRYTREIREFS